MRTPIIVHARTPTAAVRADAVSQVAFTSFFRNGSQFSYAALVAGFTAVVIFTGSNTVLGADGERVSLARITNTVVGSVIYLFVDLLLGKHRSGGCHVLRSMIYREEGFMVMLYLIW